MPFLLQIDGKTSINKDEIGKTSISTDEIIEVATAVIFEQISPFANQFFGYLEEQLDKVTGKLRKFILNVGQNDKVTEKLRKFIINVGQKILDLINEAKGRLGISRCVANNKNTVRKGI
jgi:hypothetical protein